MIRVVLLLPLCLTTTVLWAEIYKWTDANGVVHFSDKPHPGAAQITLPPVQSFSTPPVPVEAAPTFQENQEAAVASNENYTITTKEPEDLATIRNTQGYIPVSFVVEPELKNGDQIQLLLDGKPMGEPQASTVFALRNIDRGTHTIEAQILNNAGEVVSTSEEITVFMQQPRVNMGNIPPK
jgi:hypothetical protein